MIAIVDYGLGNVLAFANLYRRLNVDVAVARTPAELERAGKIILPGVGAYDHALERLEQSGMRATLDRLVLDDGVPVLGVCVGMQMLGSSSDEGSLHGLAWIEGRVRAFKSEPNFGLPLPHMGWNDVRPVADHPLFRRLPPGARFYFLHSFFFACGRSEDSAAVCDYGGEFTCGVSHRNIHGVQFHPEKSHHNGMQLLRNFAEL
jgi:glutamine amidotransferase